MNKKKALLIAAITLALGAAGLFVWYSYQTSLIKENLTDSGEAVQTAMIAPVQELSAEEKAAREALKAMQEAIASDENMSRSIDFEQLQQTNEDIYSWIYIPGTGVDYPVVQSENDEYYLKYNVDKGYDPVGAIFTEALSSKDYSDSITPIYGHSLFAYYSPYGTMFTDLANYTSSSFLEEHPYIYVYTPDAIYRYEIFAATVFSDCYLPYAYNFEDEEDVERFEQDMLSQASSKNDTLQLDGTSKIITLSTCTDPNASQRYLINAVQTLALEK